VVRALGGLKEAHGLRDARVDIVEGACARSTGPDGGFLISTELDAPPTPITLIQNWTPDAKN